MALVLDAKKYTYLSTPLTTTFDDEKKLEMACCVNMFSTSYSHFGRGFKVVVLVAGAYQSRRKKNLIYLFARHLGSGRSRVFKTGLSSTTQQPLLSAYIPFSRSFDLIQTTSFTIPLESANHSPSANRKVAYVVCFLFSTFLLARQDYIGLWILIYCSWRHQR